MIKVLTWFVNKNIPVRELVLQNILVFLVEAYLKLVLSNFSKISYCEVNFSNVIIELYRICMEIKTILK